jgi:Coatomer WD associated region
MLITLALLAHRSPRPLQLGRQKYQAPVQTNEIFYGGIASLILSSTTSVVLYDIQQQKSIAEVNIPPVKYVVWRWIFGGADEQT